MIEYLRTDNSPLDITYTASSYATNLYYEVYDLDTNDFIQSGAGAAGASSTYTITLDADSTAYDRNIKIEYITTSASGAFNDIQYASLVRPFATPDTIRSLATIDASTTDATLQKLERRARLYLQAQIGESFAKQYKSVEVYGNNTDVLSVPDKVLQIDFIYEEDIEVYDRVALTNSFDYDIEVGLSGTRISIINDDQNKEIFESPKFSVFYYDGVFAKDALYRITGVMGWEYVPPDIEQATSLLVEDYLCNDFNIRNKNIAQLSNDSYDIKYASGASGGTGNLLVDTLIDKYRQPRYMVI